MSQAIAHRPALVGGLDGHPGLDLAVGEERRPIVVVLGMHRSGTSLCSHVLSVLGADMTDHLDIHPSNANGHWERPELKAFHDQILELLGRGYDSPTHDLPLPVAWWADPQVRAIRQAIVAFLRRRIPEGSLFGFKDPRAARLLPLWNEVFAELKLAPKFVLCLRNPAQVARSLTVRDGLDPEIGEYRWFCYMTEVLANLHNQPICTIEYEDWFDDANVNLRKLMRFLDLSWERSQASLRIAIARIVDARLRHDGPGPLEPRQPLVRSLYAMARVLGEDAAAADGIGAVIDQFAAYQELHLPLHHEFARMAALAAALPERERELAALREEAESARTGRAAALAQAERSAELSAAAEAALARTAQELTQTATTLEGSEARRAAAEAERERAERTAAELEDIAEAAQAAVDALRTRLAEAERQTAERIALAESERDEIAGERDEIAEGCEQIAGERDRIAGERDRLAADSGQWFDAAILTAAERVIAARPARGWRIGRHLLQLGPLRGKGSPMQRADAARAGRQWARAARFYLDALQQAPKRAPVWVQLGHALKELGKGMEAEFAYRRAVDLDKTNRHGANRDAHVALGQLLRRQDRNAEAAAAYRRALALAPPAEQRVFLSDELAALGRQAEPSP